MACGQDQCIDGFDGLDELRRVKDEVVIHVIQMVESTDALDLLLKWIDDARFEDHRDNLAVDPGAVKYHGVEWVYYIEPRLPCILTDGNQRTKLYVLDVLT